MIDTREVKGEFILARLTNMGVEASIDTFPYETGCDYFIAGPKGSICIQRKDSMAEICGSPVSEKWSSAMEELRLDILPRLINYSNKTRAEPVLLVEESHMVGERGMMFRKDKQTGVWMETGMSAKSYYGFLEAVKHMGVDVVCTRDLSHSICFMASMDSYLKTDHYPKQKKLYGPADVATGMLCCIPTVGAVRAGKALKKMSILELATSKESDGLTKRQLEKFKEAVRTRLN